MRPPSADAAIEVLTALVERDATIAATEQRAAALQAMIANESLTMIGELSRANADSDPRCNGRDRLGLLPGLRARKASLYPQVMAYPT